MVLEKEGFGAFLNNNINVIGLVIVVKNIVCMLAAHRNIVKKIFFNYVDMYF